MGLAIFTPFYDFCIDILGYDAKFRQLAIDSIKIMGGEKILDVGCGTGSLLIKIKNDFPKTELTGIDPDKKILQIAEKKSKLHNLKISFINAYGQKLPFKSDSFDKVISSLTFHHLKLMDKKISLQEIHRVLKNGGQFLLVDHWPGNPNKFQELLHWLGGIFDDRQTMNDNIYLPNLLKETGFVFEEVATKGNSHFLLAQKVQNRVAINKN